MNALPLILFLLLPFVPVTSPVVLFALFLAILVVGHGRMVGGYLGTLIAAAVAAVVLFAVLATADAAGYERAGVAASHALAGVAFLGIESAMAKMGRRWFIGAAIGWTFLSIVLSLVYATGWHPGGSLSLFPGYRELGSIVVLLAAFGVLSAPLFGRARSKERVMTTTRRTVWFHEDDYCQIELLCDENRDWCLEETRKIAEFSEAHRAGIGWTAMYMRSPAPVALATRGITIAELAEAVAPFAPPYDAVTTGYSTHVEDALNVAAYGAEESLTLFAEHRDGVVTAIWLELGPLDERVVAMLGALSRWNLLLVDWSGGEVTPLSELVSQSQADVHHRRP